jgi:hypothetical protein
LRHFDFVHSVETKNFACPQVPICWTRPLTQFSMVSSRYRWIDQLSAASNHFNSFNQPNTISGISCVGDQFRYARCLLPPPLVCEVLAMSKDSHHKRGIGAEVWSECRDSCGIPSCKVGTSGKGSHVVAVASHFQFDVIVAADSRINPKGSLHFTKNGFQSHSWIEPAMQIRFVPGNLASKTEVGRRAVAMLPPVAAPHECIYTEIAINRDLDPPARLLDFRLQIQLCP